MLFPASRLRPAEPRSLRMVELYRVEAREAGARQMPAVSLLDPPQELERIQTTLGIEPN